jgi:hypothetical protein
MPSFIVRISPIGGAWVVVRGGMSRDGHNLQQTAAVAERGVTPAGDFFAFGLTIQ